MSSVARRLRPLGIAAGLGLLLLVSCGRAPQGAGLPAPCAGDAPLAEYQRELLALAMQTASAIPADPHIKERSKAQEAVVRVCLRLDQPGVALEWMERIDDWRRGMAYAELAEDSARRGRRDEARRYLERAGRVSDFAADWRRDRIRAAMAGAYVWLDESGQAEALARDLEPSEAGPVVRARARRSDAALFDAQMRAQEARVEAGDFDSVKAALLAYTELFRASYPDAERRARVEASLFAAWGAMPAWFRLELLMELAEASLEHGDAARAGELAHQARQLVDAHAWPPEHHVPMLARLAALRFRSGQEAEARTDAEAARALFAEQRESIVNIRRAGALRPLAEAYQAMGDSDSARAVYRQALEESLENPNSRPRAEDLAATCLSLALAALEPDADLWQRIHAVHRGLGEPW